MPTGRRLGCPAPRRESYMTCIASRTCTSAPCTTPERACGAAGCCKHSTGAQRKWCRVAAAGTGDASPQLGRSERSGGRQLTVACMRQPAVAAVAAGELNPPVRQATVGCLYAATSSCRKPADPSQRYRYDAARRSMQSAVRRHRQDLHMKPLQWVAAWPARTAVAGAGAGGHRRVPRAHVRAQPAR